MITHNDLPRLAGCTPVCVMGAAVVDVIADAYSLPHRGSDIELHQQGINVGGCALNVAIALHRLGIEATNALPVGKGIWAGIVAAKMAEYGITSPVHTDKGDNGWCLALVEPDGERTFLSVSGVENQWDEAMLAQFVLPERSWIYLSGYQLTAASGERLVAWLEAQRGLHQLLIDFGPRLAVISDNLFQRVMALKPLVTLNRQEAGLMSERLVGKGTAGSQQLMADWREHFDSGLIVRMDSEGAGYVSADRSGWVPALTTTVVDTIGAGDSHAGGVLAGLASGWTLGEAVMLGNAVASYVVAHRGGDCAPDRSELSVHWQRHITQQ
ncbi:PfkB family carbohydrate kinase [Pantoea sp. BAV 3049]|uniref:PfkB family carbohydrate kinase n=1 Tax=Pantoea sp. BAV 3049 TaxID=2654188 RepID=UPI00131DFFA3|nr:PfkB family carbohydrate kinase [Pantoea sp. BAV 3049]